MSSNTKPCVEDDDDLDDLDDIVDQFDSEPSKSSASATIATTSKSNGTPTPAPTSNTVSSSLPSTEDDILSEEFAKQFAENMESLMRDLGTDDPEQQERNLAWEKMLIEGMNGLDLGLGAPGPSGSSSTTADQESEKAPGSFKESIMQTMNKLKDSDSTLKSDASSAAGSSDPLESLLSSLADNFDSADTDEELQGVLETMMQQLMSKEVLYEPLKELNDKFPTYLEDHANSISSLDKSRYQDQIVCVTKIVAAFEDPAYDDNNPEKNMSIVNLMNEMQSYGSPPKEIMGPLPPGMDLGPDGMPNIPDNCVIS